MKLGRMSWGPEQQRRALMLAMVALLGGGGVVWVFGPALDEVDALETAVAKLQAQPPLTRSVPAQAWSTQAASAPPEPVASTDWPEPVQATTLWPWLQQRLQAQGLRVLALRPQTMNATASGLPEQAVVLQLQGRWLDWQTWSQDMAAHATWWRVDQWQLVPAEAGQVRIELQARVGLQPDRSTWVAPEWPLVRAALDSRDSLFGLHGAQEVGGSRVSAPHALESASPDPRGWPVRALRLQGLWQQADQWHAVLGNGLAQVTVRAGQRVGQEGYRVQRIAPDGVVLGAEKGAPVLRLDWQGGQP